MTTEDWLFDAGQNRLVIRFDGKLVILRSRTLHQIERFKDMQKKQAEQVMPADQENSPAERLGQNLEFHLDLAEIAMNPDPQKLDYPRDLIRIKMDPGDLEWFVIKHWLPRFLNPPASRDPNLPPPPAGVR